MKHLILIAAAALAVSACSAGPISPGSTPPPVTSTDPAAGSSSTGGIVKDVAHAAEVPAVVAAEAVLGGQFDSMRVDVLNGKYATAELGKLRVKVQLAYGAAVTARVTYDFTAGLDNSPVSSALIDEIRRSTDASFNALLAAIDERVAT